MPIREWLMIIAVSVAMIASGLLYLQHATAKFDAERLYRIENGSGPVCRYIGEELND